MMELYVVRHGIAEDFPPDGSGDFGRRLTPDGIARMEQAARGMVRLGIAPDLLLSSPLVRARQTAEIVGRALGRDVRIEPRLASGCSVADIQAVLADVAQTRTVMIFGHEPDLSTAIGALTGGSRVEMKKGMMAALHLQGRHGVLLSLLPPRVLRQMAGATDG